MTILRLTVIGALLTATVLASANGVVPARTGGFGEMTCHQCHSENPLNDPAGQLQLTGIPQVYTPGQRYAITVALSHPQLVRAGFQVAARFETGQNAGTFHPGDERVEAIPDDGGRITYAQHTNDGSLPPSTGAGRWTFEWEAPAEGLPVVFHAAGNAADGDGRSRGDFVYTATAATRPAAAAR